MLNLVQLINVFISLNFKLVSKNFDSILILPRYAIA